MRAAPRTPRHALLELRARRRPPGVIESGEASLWTAEDEGGRGRCGSCGAALLGPRMLNDDQVRAQESPHCREHRHLLGWGRRARSLAWSEGVAFHR